MDLRRSTSILVLSILVISLVYGVSVVSAALSRTPAQSVPSAVEAFSQSAVEPRQGAGSGAAVGHSAEPVKLPAEVSADWWSTVQQDIRQSEYRVTWQDETYLPDVPAAYQAPNRAHNLRTYFAPDGIRVIPRAGDPASWEWGLTLVGYGYAGDVRPTATAELVAADNRLVYQRGEVLEWYVNDERGLEQGFTLAAPPEAGSGIREAGFGKRDSGIVLSLALSGSLIPNLSGDRTAIEFTTVGGVGVLRYSDLLAYDATGRTLPAHMELVDCRADLPPASCFVHLVVDDTNAVYPLTIDPLTTSPSWTAESNQDGALFGWSVGTAGDVNGDGYSDVIIGAMVYDNGETDEGRAYVYHGSATGLSTIADWTAESDQAGARFGFSAGAAGDVNGDGYADVIVGADQYDNGETNEGRAYVYYGSAAGLGTTAAWVAEGNQPSAVFGYDVGTAGDVNGDGYYDVVIGAHGYNSGLGWAQGRVYVYHGSAVGLSTTADWAVQSDQAGSYFGVSVGTAGDLNGDGYADVVVGAYFYNNGEYREGRAYVYHGSATGLSTSANWTVEPDQVEAGLGLPVGTAGDVNGDGYADVLIGAASYNVSEMDEGRVYIYYGSSTGLTTGAADWTAEGDQANGYFGLWAGTAGDVNGDGFADVIIGAYRYDHGETDEGRAYVYHGSATGLSPSAVWTMESDQAGARFGYRAGTAGDVNGDGYADVIVGAYYYDSGETDEGRVFVYHGGSTGLGASSEGWTAESDQAVALFGWWVDTAGDVNGDGYSDVIVGARNYDGGQTDEGRAYVYLGSAMGLITKASWTTESNQAEAYLGAGVGTAGDVNGDGYADVIVGAWGYDNGQTGEGRAYVYYGSGTGLTTGAADWMVESNQSYAYMGYAVGSAGDVNGDGYDDVVVGAYGYNSGVGWAQGRVYVYHGAAAGLSTTADRIVAGDQADSYFGLRVGTAGDVNGDGYDDVVVGAYFYSNGEYREGRAFVYHGLATGLSATANWTAESDQADARMGVSVGTAGDVNGDGYADVIVGVVAYDNGETNEGRAYVYHGSATGLSTVASWTAESNQAGAAFGFSVGTVGDVNGDGYADVIVGAYLYDSGQTDEGRVFVYYGSASGLTATAVWTAESDQADAYFGYEVARAGDVNGDGCSDVIVGAPYYDNGETHEGRAYVYYGSAIGLTTNSPEWTAESDQTDARLGYSAGTAGDVDGDGYSDVIVGAYTYDNGQTDEGRAYVYLGSAIGLSTAPAWTAESNQDGAFLGISVGTAGDVNGDGYSDVVVGAYDYDNGQTDEGRAYVYHGSSTGLTTGAADWMAEGNQAYAWFGYFVGTAGDVNGDGYSDVIVAAFGYNNGQTDEGRAYVYHGSATGLTTGSADWTAESDQTGAFFGSSVGTAGDVNGDGYDDVIVGAWYYDGDQTNEGRAYVYLGSVTGLSTASAWTAESDQVNAHLGIWVGTAGDVNGDGYADVIVGAHYYDNGETDEGRAYVFHGSATGLTTGSADWMAEGDQDVAHFGHSVATAGDVNGDGYADVVVGASHYDSGQTDEGRVYVYHGSPAGLAPGAADWIVESGQANSRFGRSVSTAGDVNGDGYDDVIVGAYFYDNGQTDEGQAYVYHGSPKGLAVNAADWRAESDQADADFGWFLSMAGDVNGDGYGDVIVGAPLYDNGETDEGRAFVYHGSATGLTTGAADWTAESDQAEARFGFAVGTAGDVNGDGYADVIVGADYYDSGETDEGRAYVYHGSSTGLTTGSADWTAESNQAGARLGVAVGTAGDVNGDGYGDAIVGAYLYDNGETDEGRAYVYHGSSTGLTTGSADWTAESDQAGAEFGVAAGTAGDVNGDGYADVIVGAYYYDNGETDEGRAFVYHGSATGLSPGMADWTVESDRALASLGIAVGTAGDVNGDGYSDVIIGAYLYDGGEYREGRAYVHHGSATGLTPGPADWMVESNQASAYLGYSAGTAGDVNGDGYADVIVGARLYDDGETDEGRAWVYHGSQTGLSTTADWTAESDQAGAQFGVAVGTAGDVNGDGYADVIVGAYRYDNGETDEGRVSLYYGNGEDGLDLRPRQMRTGSGVQVAPLGRTDGATAVQLRLTGRMPLGREQVKLEWQVAPLGTPFTATSVISGTSPDWTDTLTTGVVISQNVTGLAPGTPYHWRARLRYRPGNRLGQAFSRWVHIPWNGWTEQDFRTPPLESYVCTPETQDADVVLVVDRSTSMGEGGKLAAAQAAVSAFLDRLAAPPEQAALVSFAYTATLDAPLTTDVEAVRTAVNGLVASGLTRIDLGLEEARQELGGGRHVATHSKIIILLSDGQQTGEVGPVLAEAAAAKSEGALIFTIGLGAAADGELLQQVASGPAYYYYAPSGEELEEIYLAISTVIACPDIGGRVFVDWNEDGAYTDGVDEPLGGVEVGLLGGVAPLTATSEVVSGSYLFGANPAGSYTLTVELASVPAGYEATTATVRLVELVYRDELGQDFGFVPAAGLRLAKGVTPTVVASRGDWVTYTFRVSNTGGTWLTPVTVTDGLLGGVVCTAPVGKDPLAPGEGFSCEAVQRVMTDTVNVAWATGVGAGLAVSDTATATVRLARTAIGGRVYADWDGDGEYTSGRDTGLAGVALELEGPEGRETRRSGSPEGSYQFPAKAVGTYTLTVQQGSVPVGYGATTPISRGLVLTAQEQLGHDFGFYAPRGLALQKTVSPTELPQGGGWVTYTFRVSNTGQVALSPVTVTDGMLGGVVCTNPEGQDPLLAGSGFSCEATALILTDTVNEARVRGVPLQVGGGTLGGMVVSDTATARVRVVGGMAEHKRLYLPLIMRYYAPPVSLPWQVGEGIAAREVSHQGEVFYSQTARMPGVLPAGGHFYFSSRPNNAAEVLVDDELVVESEGVELFSYVFATGGSNAVPALVEVLRATMEQMAGRTVTVKYHDIYGGRVEASEMWLIWTP